MEQKQTDFATKIIWAVDAFSDMPALQLRAGQVIRQLFNPNVIVQPATTLQLGRFDPESQTFQEYWKELSEAAEKNLSTLLSMVEIPGIRPPKFLRQNGTSIKQAVESLIDFAFQEESDLIVVSSHARKGASRLVMGSFAETLLLRSPIPVLIMNPKCRKMTWLRHILFPTDFSTGLREVFEQIVRHAAQSETKILLYHKMQYIYPEFGYPFVVPIVSPESVAEQKELEKEEAKRWVNWASMLGVEVKPHLSTQKYNIVEDILRTSKKLGPYTIIAMASLSGPISAFILGSVTRQVVREASCPVLVIHPRRDNVAKGFAKNSAFHASGTGLLLNVF